MRDGVRDAAVCRTCDAEAQQLRQWAFPRGRPTKKYNPDLNEWVIEGSIPDGYPTSLTHLDNVRPRHFIHPWPVLDRDLPPGREDCVFSGYTSSLLVSLQFQLQNDGAFEKDMKFQENLVTNNVFPGAVDTKVLNPFRMKIWDKLFDGELKEKLESIFPTGFHLSYDAFRVKSESFCKYILENVKNHMRHGRIAKYFGSIWTSNTIKNAIPNFDTYLEKFEQSLNSIMGSSLNDHCMVTPPSKKQKVARPTGDQVDAAIGANLNEVSVTGVDSFTSMLIEEELIMDAGDEHLLPGFEDGVQTPVANLTTVTTVTHQRTTTVPEGFDSPTRDISRRVDQRSSLADTNFRLSELYRDIFITKRIRFRDERFQHAAMNEFAIIQTGAHGSFGVQGESADSKLMKFVFKAHPDTLKFVQNYMHAKMKESDDGQFYWSDFTRRFCTQFLEPNLITRC